MITKILDYERKAIIYLNTHTNKAVKWKKY